ncbi:hypothetical protein JYT91_00875, partial [archaeon AH-315-M20]|nr:hypothetical protein [archaeon AH-315-M20]
NEDKLLKDSEFLKLKLSYDILKTKYPEKNIFDILKKDFFIPSSIFNENLSTSEAIIKYLVENCGLSLSEIAKLINRTSKNIWYTYNKSKKKFSKKIAVKTSILIPISIVRNLDFTLLENVVSYLKEKLGLSYHEIAVLLQRDDRTIWTVYNRVKKKRGKL